jgi:hypothetical protein
MSSVYLAPHVSHNRFKIGISLDPAQRLASLKEDFDLGGTWLISCSTSGHAREVERTLHFLFRKYRIMVPEAGDGHTEWFDMWHWNLVFEFVQANQSLLNYTHLGLLVPLQERARAFVTPTVPLNKVMARLVEVGLMVAEKDPALFKAALERGLPLIGGY